MSAVVLQVGRGDVRDRSTGRAIKSYLVQTASTQTTETRERDHPSAISALPLLLHARRYKVPGVNDFFISTEPQCGSHTP